MAKIVIEIDSCEKCPYSKVSKVYTRDSFENVRKVNCSVLDVDVYKYLDWYDKAPVPEFCPKRLEE